MLIIASCLKSLTTNSKVESSKLPENTTLLSERHHATTANAIVSVGFVSQREPIIDLLYLGCKQRIEWDRVGSIRQKVCDAIVDSLIPCDTNRSSLNLVASQLLLCIWILFHLV